VATGLIERMSRVGWMVKMELRLADGQSLSVEISKDRAQELGLVEGDRVLVNLKDAKVFVQDYAI
jgi:sulfate transport system ATP-binding protein